jgi:hypothetical protein
MSAERELRAERDHWIRQFNRLDAAITHHRAADRFKDDHDDALYAARDRVLKDIALPGEYVELLRDLAIATKKLKELVEKGS